MSISYRSSTVTITREIAPKSTVAIESVSAPRRGASTAVATASPSEFEARYALAKKQQRRWQNQQRTKTDHRKRMIISIFRNRPSTDDSSLTASSFPSTEAHRNKYKYFSGIQAKRCSASAAEGPAISC